MVQGGGRSTTLIARNLLVFLTQPVNLASSTRWTGTTFNCGVLKSGDIRMKLKINEDWLSVIIAFALIVLAMIGIVSPTWMTF